MEAYTMYTQVQGKSNQEELVAKHAPLVKRIAYHLKGRLPDSVQIDDMIQSGMIGLLEAARNFDASQGASFETYAGIRIRGAMLDEIRTGDWTPRSVHRKAREMNDAINNVEKRFLRQATDQEIAEEMGVSLDEYYQILRNASVAKIFSTDDSEVEQDYQAAFSDHEVPDRAYNKNELAKELEQIIDNLPERERLVMSLYYEEEMNLREIGEVLGVSESRVSQIHGKSLLTLKAKLAHKYDRIK